MMKKKEDRTYLVLWTTGRCNLRCKYCYAYGEQWQRDMDFAVAQKAVDALKDRPLKIQFTGGEPLLNFKLMRQVYAYAKNQGYDCVFQLQTNGTLIDADIAAEIREMGISTGVSLDGPVDVNEALRGGTKRALQGIQELGKKGVRVNLNSTVTAQNVERLPELMDFAVYLGNVAGIGLDLLRFSGRAGEKESPVEKPGEAQLVKTIYALSEKSRYFHETTGIKIGVRPIEEAKKRLRWKLNNRYYCYASCGKSYVVLPNGDVFPCGTLKDHKEFYMGNIHEGQIKSCSLPSLPKNDSCVACPYHQYCPGACPARVITNWYDTSSDHLDCTMRKTAFAIAAEEIKNGIF